MHALVCCRSETSNCSVFMYLWKWPGTHSHGQTFRWPLFMIIRSNYPVCVWMDRQASNLAVHANSAQSVEVEKSPARAGRQCQICHAYVLHTFKNCPLLIVVCLFLIFFFYLSFRLPNHSHGNILWVHLKISTRETMSLSNIIPMINCALMSASLPSATAPFIWNLISPSQNSYD